MLHLAGRESGAPRLLLAGGAVLTVVLSGTVSVITGLNGHSLSVLAIGLGMLTDVTGSATLI